MEIIEIVKEYIFTLNTGMVLVPVKARIVKQKEIDSYFYITSQLFKERGAAEYYKPGATGLTIEEVEQKLFDYMAKFEYSVGNGASNTGNPAYIS